MEVIEEKIQNRPHVAKVRPRKSAGDVVDLLAVLKSSLEGNRDARKRPGKPASRTAPALAKTRRKAAA